MTERKHHDYSPSQLQVLEVCPSYEGRQSFSKAADDGTRQHAVAETGTDDETLTDEHIDAALEAVAFVARQKQILEEARTKVVNSTLAALGCTVEEAENSVRFVTDLSEVYLPIDAEETTGGYADSLLISHDHARAILTDFKFGQWAAEIAENNLQGIAYSLGAFFRFPTLEKVEVHFFQPALKAAVNSVTWARSDVPALLLRVKTVVARAKLARSRGDFQMVNPTVPGCLFCANLALCPAVASLVLRVGHKFHSVDVPDDITPSMIHDAANSTMGMRLASLVTAWAHAFRSLTTDRVLRGDAPVPDGYEISQGAGKRKIIDNEKFKEAALKYLTTAAYDATVAPQLGAVEAAIKDTAPRGQKDSTVKQFKTELLDAGAVEPGRKYPCLKAKNSEDNSSDTVN